MNRTLRRCPLHRRYHVNVLGTKFQKEPMVRKSRGTLDLFHRNCTGELVLARALVKC